MCSVKGDRFFNCGVHCGAFLKGDCKHFEEFLEYAEEEILNLYDRMTVYYNDTEVAAQGVIMGVGTGQIEGSSAIVPTLECIKWWGRTAGTKQNPAALFKRRFLSRMIDGRVFGVYGGFVKDFEKLELDPALVYDRLKLAHSLETGSWKANVETFLGHEAAVFFDFLGLPLSLDFARRSL